MTRRAETEKTRNIGLSKRAREHRGWMKTYFKTGALNHLRRDQCYYLTVRKYGSAVELAREANKLRVVADVWLRGDKALPSYPGTNFDLPEFRPAGCDDLNPLSSVAVIGI